MDQVYEVARNVSLLVSDAFASLEAQTGLSPVLFFVVIGLLLGSYYLISGILVPAQIGAAPPSGAPNLNIGEISALELAQYDGENADKPLLLAVRGTIYDVSSGRDFYGPGAPYGEFAGKDASRALAKLRVEKQDLSGDLDGLGEDELAVLKSWEQKISEKYPKVGVINGTVKDREAEKKDEGAAEDEKHATEKKGPSQTASEEEAKSSTEYEHEETTASKKNLSEGSKPAHEQASPELDPSKTAAKTRHASTEEDSSISRDETNEQDQSATSAAI